MNENTEIRKLPAAAIYKLGQILDTENAWQKVMAMIPSDPNDFNSVAKYTPQHIKWFSFFLLFLFLKKVSVFFTLLILNTFRLIQTAGEKQNKSCTEILFDEWGTSGEVRPNLNTLLQILIKAQFYRAAEFVAVELLKGDLFNLYYFKQLQFMF